MANADIPEPAMRPIRPSGPVPGAPGGLVLKPKACIHCRTRKVKCDRKTPCRNCVCWSVECVFPSPIRKCRRPRKATAGTSPGSGSSSSTDGRRSTPPEVMQRLEETLHAIEAFIKTHRGVEQGGHSPSQAQPNEQDSSMGTGSWVDLRCKLGVAGDLLARLADNGSFAPPALPVPTLLGGLSTAFGVLNSPAPRPFPMDTFSLDVSTFHPSPAQIRISWQAFLLHIDPLVKVLHRSTTERILHNAIRDPISLSVGEAAIVFTIYFSSLSTLSDEDAGRCFGIPKQAAQSTFISAAEHALSKISANAQPDLTSLQAFVLFLSLGRFTDHAPRVWALTGFVRRLDYISAWKSSSPFEDEIRRRLRWELWCLDHRAHEDGGRGSAPPDTGGSPELPLNIRDVELVPSMTTAPRTRSGWTEISFSLVRFDIARTARTIELLPSTPEKLAMVDECEQRVESTYLRYCDGSEPVHWLARHVAHVLLMELRFKLLRHDRHSGPYLGGYAETRMPLAKNDLFQQAIDIVDTPRRVEAEPQARQWSWLLVGYLQFWPLSFLLRELRYRHGSDEVERGWGVAEQALARRTKDDTSKNMETLRCLMEEARLEKNNRLSRDTIETAFTDAGRQLIGPSSTCLTDLPAPTVFEPLLRVDLAGQGPDLARDMDGSLGYTGLEDSFLSSAYNGLAWDEIAPSDGSADGPSNLDLDDGGLFQYVNVPPVDQYFTHTT